MDKWLNVDNERKKKHIPDVCKKNGNEREHSFSCYLHYLPGCAMCMADGILIPILMHPMNMHRPCTLHILHMAIAFTHSHLTVLMLFSAYMYISRRKAANDRIILAASCLFVEVSCGIILRPWQMQWEMSSKPYHSLCKQEIYAQEECEEMWNPVKSLNWLPVFDAVVFILSLVNTLCTAQCSSRQTYIQSTPFGTIYICFNFKLLRKHSDNETERKK